VLLDPFDRSLDNANFALIAPAGSGKSFFCKLLMLRQLAIGTDCIAVDPENEYACHSPMWPRPRPYRAAVPRQCRADARRPRGNGRPPRSYMLLIKPSIEAVKRHHRALRAAVRDHKAAVQTALLIALNPIIRVGQRITARLWPRRSSRRATSI
jgi:ABC-type dipeptide/oligopeptide/nickel transport system ATPase component